MILGGLASPEWDWFSLVLAPPKIRKVFALGNPFGLEHSMSFLEKMRLFFL